MAREFTILEAEVFRRFTERTGCEVTVREGVMEVGQSYVDALVDFILRGAGPSHG